MVSSFCRLRIGVTIVAWAGPFLFAPSWLLDSLMPIAPKPLLWLRMRLGSCNGCEQITKHCIYRLFFRRADSTDTWTSTAIHTYLPKFGLILGPQKWTLRAFEKLCVMTCFVRYTTACFTGGERETSKLAMPQLRLFAVLM